MALQRKALAPRLLSYAFPVRGGFARHAKRKVFGDSIP